MINLNPFRTMSKATRNNIFCINAIAVDVDYKSIKELKNLTPSQIIGLLEMDFFDVKIPTPNFIEYGNQVRLIFGIETAYVPKRDERVLILAKRISEVFASELKEYGAEKQNIESYVRVPGSINTKNNSKVNILVYDDSFRYTLRELQELWLEELPKWYKKRKGRVKVPKKVVKLHNVYSLNCNRLRDFEKIQEYLNSLGVSELRARLCFQVRNYNLIKLKYQNGELKAKDYEFAKEEMLKFNNNFNVPLRENIIEGATRVVNQRQYLYKNDSMIKFFNENSSIEIDYELCEELGLESIYKVKERVEINKEYYERNTKNSQKKYKEKLKSEGKLTEKEKLSQRRAKIKDLLDEGLKQKDICLRLNISEKTYKRDRNYLKDQGLI